MVRHHIRIMRSIDFLSQISLQVRHWSYKHSFINPLRCNKSIITKIVDKFRITSPRTKLVERHAKRGGEGYPDERHAMVRDGRKRTTLLNLMMKDGFGDLGIETGVCRGPLSPFNVGCVSGEGSTLI